MQKSNKEQNIQYIFDQIQMKIHTDNQSLFAKIEHIYLSHYNKEQKIIIYRILEKWKNQDIYKLIKDQVVNNVQNYHLYKDIEILSARVYHKVIQLINCKDKNLINDQSLQELREFMLKQNLQFSYYRFFLQKKRKFTQSIFNTFSLSMQQKQSSQYINKMYQIFQEKQDCLIIKLLNFLMAIQLVVRVQKSDKIQNKFIKNLQRIRQSQQKQLYLNSIKMQYLQELKEANSKKGGKEAEYFIVKKQCPNYIFYSSKNYKSINSLHNKYKDYTFLQESHDYIQLMFPNHFASSFNQDSVPLNYVQRKIFNKDLKIGLKMLKSIFIFFDFLGIRIDLTTCQIILINKARLIEALIINIHNHLRIMRILACLSITGFRNIALNLIAFLDKSIAYIEEFSCLRKVFEENWKVYGQQKYLYAKSMCFLQEETFPQEHLIFSLFKNAEPIKFGKKLTKK